MTQLEQQIRAKIRAKGPLTYREFVETVLFDPQEGYYRHGKPDRRDFLTSPEAHPIFGETIARYVCHLADLTGEERFSILELGGGAGRLAEAVIGAAPASRLERYVILEKTPKDKRIGIVEWTARVEELPVFDGFTFVIANEFFDALPFHRVIMEDGRLKEIYVGFEDGFIDISLPLSSDLADFLQDYPIYLNEHQTIEATPGLATLGVSLAAVVTRGAMVIFDYGYHLEDIAFGAFFDGSMVSYGNYVMRSDVFSALGERDISHHVNFDHLTAIMSSVGWKKNGERAQYRFLSAMGIGSHIGSLVGVERRAARMLLDPDAMGSAFRVLGFLKGYAIKLPGF